MSKIVKYPGVKDNATRETIASEMSISQVTLREMLRDIGVPDRKHLSPLSIKKFRIAYIDGPEE